MDMSSISRVISSMRRTGWQQIIGWIVLGSMVIGGMYFRLQGIERNLSFWNDEIHAAYFSRAVLEHGVPITQTGHYTGLYQIALYYLTAFMFALGGISEFAARVPSVIAGTLLIVVVYAVAKKITNTTTAYVASFLTAFSQIQLAWSTQFRPYIWLELCVVVVAYCAYKYISAQKMIDRYIVYAVLVSLVASLFHGTGLVNFVLISLVFIYKIIARKKYQYLLLLLPLSIFVTGIIYFSLSPINRTADAVFHVHTDLLHYRVFLRANYWWLLSGAVVGGTILWIRSKERALILCGFPLVIFLAAIFKFNAQYVRYSLPAFPFLYILFGYGLVIVAETAGIVTKHMYVKYGTLLLLVVFFLWQPIRTNKILLAPRYYYTINGDMRENPIVDYKRAFERIKKLRADRTSFVVMDAWNDRVPWFLPEQPYIFLIEHRPATVDPVFGEPMIATIKEFVAAQQQYQAGIVVVENWESQTAYNVQQYIRNHLQHEFDVENLPHNEADKWSISIYSWGIAPTVSRAKSRDL